MSHLRICLVQEKDLPQVYEIELISFKQPYPPFFINALARQNLRTFIVAEKNEKVVGYLVATIRSKSLGHILSMAVHPSERGKGIGTLLIQHIIEILRKMGVTYIRLEVRKSNIPAQKLYEKIGFKQVYIIESYYQEEDAIVMMLHLS